MCGSWELGDDVMFLFFLIFSSGSEHVRAGPRILRTAGGGEKGVHARRPVVREKRGAEADGAREGGVVRRSRHTRGVGKMKKLA